MNYFFLSYEVNFGMDIIVQRDVLVKTEHHGPETYFDKLRKVFEGESEEESMVFLGSKVLDEQTFHTLENTEIVVFDDETI